VDDEESQLHLFTEALKHLDPSIEVSVCDSPFKALELLDRGFYHCLVSDYNMPGMTGVELARRVKASKGLPVILFSGRSLEELTPRAIGAGVDDIVRKEVDPWVYTVLVRRVRQLVERFRGSQLFQAAFHLYPEPCIVAVSGRVVAANKACSDLLGFEEGDLEGASLLEVFRGDARTMVLSGSVVYQPPDYTFQVEALTPAGGVKSLRVRAFNTYYLGQPAQILFLKDAVLEDGERARWDRLEWNLEGFLEESIVGVALVDQEGGLVRCNRFFAQAFGLEEGCRVFKLLEEPRFLRRLGGSLLPGSTHLFQEELDFSKLRAGGYLETSRSDTACFKLLVRPWADGDGWLYLVEALEEKSR